MRVCWLAQSARGVPQCDDWLSPAECETLARLRIPKRRADWRLGRWTAKLAIATRLGISGACGALSQIEVRAAESGAPRAFFGGKHTELAISLSHSHDVGFCALADDGVALGCDIEWIEPRSPAFLADYFTPGEQDFLQTQEPRRDELATLLWSAKESVLKAQSCGLRADPRSVEAQLLGRLTRAADWSPLTACSPGAKFTGWWRTTGAFVWTVVALPASDEPPQALRS